MSVGTHLNNVRWSAARKRMIGADQGKRERDDFYETPSHAIADLLRVESFTGPIWEPACGRGAISEALIAHGHEVVSSDLVDRDYGETGIDFLMEHQLRCPNVVTNPPFKLALEFVLHSLALGATKTAMLLKIAFLEGQERRKRLFDKHPPARTLFYSTRVACVRGGGAKGDATGGGMMAFMWAVWERDHRGPPTLGWLP